MGDELQLEGPVEGPNSHTAAAWAVAARAAAVDKLCKAPLGGRRHLHAAVVELGFAHHQHVGLAVDSRAERVDDVARVEAADVEEGDH